VAKQQVVLVRRDDRAKEFVPITRLRERIPELLADLQRAIYERAHRFRAENTHEVESYEEFKRVIETRRGFVMAGWDGDRATEARIKEETKATIRCIPIAGGEPTAGLRCILSGRPARHRVVFARAY
jgi:prolyl-tRNA synthetase